MPIPQAHRDSDHSPGVATALTPTLDWGLPEDQAPGPHSCSQSPSGLSPAQLLTALNPHCLSKPLGMVQTSGVDTESWDCQAVLSRAGLSGTGEEGKKVLPLAEHLLGARGGVKTSTCVGLIYLPNLCLGG